MRKPRIVRTARARILQPVLNVVARRQRHARALAATLRLSCAACGHPLSAHIAGRNRWIGCWPVLIAKKGGAR